MKHIACVGLVTAILFVECSVGAVEPKPPLSFAGICQAYLEALNPVAAFRELRDEGVFKELLHPISGFLRRDREYMDHIRTVSNRRQLAEDRDFAERYPHLNPVRADDALNQRMAKASNWEYHVVVSPVRFFDTAEDGFQNFKRGWALFLNPQTKIVEHMIGPRGESGPPRD